MRGPKVFKGYWRDPEATAAAFAGGWFHTGDIGVRDEDGYLFIVDRLKDMIVSGGENIAGSEVERVLYEHEAVLEAGGRRAPGRALGRGAGGLRRAARRRHAPRRTRSLEHCRERLARFKVPKDITFLDALPRNPSGKVLKRELREADQSHVPEPSDGRSSYVPSGSRGRGAPGSRPTSPSGWRARCSRSRR